LEEGSRKGQQRQNTGKGGMIKKGKSRGSTDQRGRPTGKSKEAEGKR